MNGWFGWYLYNKMSSNKESMNVIKTFCNMYIPVNCPEKDNVGFEIPIFIVENYLINVCLWVEAFLLYH